MQGQSGSLARYHGWPGLCAVCAPAASGGVAGVEGRLAMDEPNLQSIPHPKSVPNLLGGGETVEVAVRRALCGGRAAVAGDCRCCGC